MICIRIHSMSQRQEMQQGRLQPSTRHRLQIRTTFALAKGKRCTRGRLQPSSRHRLQIRTHNLCSQPYIFCPAPPLLPCCPSEKNKNNKQKKPGSNLTSSKNHKQGKQMSVQMSVQFRISLLNLTFIVRILCGNSENLC